MFDAHTGVLPDRLFELTPKYVLTMFFSDCTPSLAFEQLISDSKNAFQGDLFTGCARMIEKVKGKIDGEEAYKLYFDFSEDLQPLQLTRKGAHALLESLGYLKQGL